MFTSWEKLSGEEKGVVILHEPDMETKPGSWMPVVRLLVTL